MKVQRNNNTSVTKVTLVCCVHGNEVFGKEVFDYFSGKLVKYPGLTVILANERALKAGKRFIESDLNRVFPGNKKGDYENHVAASLMQEIDENSLIIDIHTTTSPLIFTPIVTNLSRGTRIIINQCNSEEIVLMTNGKSSLIGQFKGGVSLEYGEKYIKNNKVIPDIEKMVRCLLLKKVSKPVSRKLYRCSAALPKELKLPIESKNFKALEGTNIIPFLIFEKNYTEYSGFALGPFKLVVI